MTLPEVNALRKAQYEGWVSTLQQYLAGKRGNYSRLARQLGVNRQTVWRWFGPGYRSRVPGWAAVCANVWHAQELQKDFSEVKRWALSRSTPYKQITPPR